MNDEMGRVLESTPSLCKWDNKKEEENPLLYLYKPVEFKTELWQNAIKSEESPLTLSEIIA